MLETNTKNQNQIPSYRLRLGVSFIWLKILKQINKFLNFFSLRETRQYWGIVYDSISKQPLDPVIVKLLYVDGQEVDTCVTDLAGRYGFLARPGKFKIYARKTNYSFPSRYAAGDKDGIYENLYHGEFFKLSDDYEVVAPNIPMDPTATDWNQKAKRSVLNKYPYLKYLVKVLAALVFWFGFIVTGILICAAYPKIPMLLYGIAAVYLLSLVFSVLLPDARLWGQIKGNVALGPGDYLFLELRDSRFPQISFGKTAVKEGGKFLLRANKGKYLLFVSKVNIDKSSQSLGTLKVAVGREGVFNSTVVVKKV
jgi:hypothetical protein